MLLLFHKHDHIISSDRYTSSLDSFPAYGLGPILYKLTDAANATSESSSKCCLPWISTLYRKCTTVHAAELWEPIGRTISIPSRHAAERCVTNGWPSPAAARYGLASFYGLSIQSIVFTSNKIFMWVRNVTKLRKAKMNRLRRKA